MGKIAHSIAACLIISSGMAFSHKVSAQTDEGNVSGLEDIVVTARKREENIQRTPAAVSALSATMLENNRLIRIDDLQKSVPSLVIYAPPGLIGTATFSLRGVTAQDYIPTNENPVALYIDGVYVARPFGALFNLTDLERVEVLRGPQGTLNGRNATAGSISLFTKAPSDTFGVSQKFSYGTFNNFVSTTRVDTGEIGNTGISARFAYSHQQQDGYVRNLQTRPNNSPGSLNDNAFFAAIHGQWGDLTIDYKFDYDKRSGQGGMWQIVAGTPNFVNFLTTYNPGFKLQPDFLDTLNYRPGDRSRDKTQGHNLTIRWQVSDAIELKSITGFRKLNTFYGSLTNPYLDLRGNVSPTGTAPFTVRDIQISNIATVYVNQKQKSQEFQLTGESGAFSYVGGLYYFREEASQNYGTIGSQSLAVLSPTTGRYGAPSFLDFNNVVKSKAVYGQLSYTPPILDDRLELTVGARYTKDNKRLVQTQPSPGSIIVPIPRNVRRADDNFSAEGSIRFQMTQDTMAYLRVAQAYKAGGYSPRDTTFAVNGYGPEKVISYELGLKTDLFDRRVRLNTNVYLSKLKDLQITQVFNAADGCQINICTTFVNAGSTEYRGVEAELTVIPVPGLEFNGNVSYIDPKFKSLRLNTNLASDIAKDPTTVFSYLSKITSAASATYTLHDAISDGDLSFRASWNYSSRRYSGNRNLPTNFVQTASMPGFHNVGAQINLTNMAVAGAQMSLSLYADNLLDKHRVLQGLDAGTYALKTFGPGRTFGFSIKAELN